MEEQTIRKQNERKRIDKDTRRNLIEKFGKKCFYCGCNHYWALTIDHKVPLSRGGEDNIKNMQIICGFCNQLKVDLTDKEFKKFLRGLNTLAQVNKIHANTAYPKIELKAYNCMSNQFKTEQEKNEFNRKRNEDRKEEKKKEIKELINMIKKEDIVENEKNNL